MNRVELKLTVEDPAEQALSGARSLLKTFAPQVLPIQPTTLQLKKQLSPYSVGGVDGVATYMGPLAGTHYIEVLDEVPGGGNLFRLITTAHELTHQWLAEVMGPTLWHDLPPLTAADFDGMLENKTPEEVFHHIEQLSEDTPKLTDALAEGLAQITERIIFERLIQRMIEFGEVFDFEGELVKFSQVEYSNLLGYPVDDDGHHREGYELVFNLMRRLGGFEQFVRFLGNVDYAQANRIERGDEEYGRILRYPSRIPLLGKARRRTYVARPIKRII